VDKIAELERMAFRVAEMRRADRRKGAHGGYQAIIDRIVAQIHWLRTNEPKVIGLVEAHHPWRKGK
jgi:hypothetical protein